MVSPNPCLRPSQKIKISLFLFSPKLPSVDKNSELESNSMPYPVYLYLSRLAFLVRFTDPNKQLLNIKSVLKFLNCGTSL